MNASTQDSNVRRSVRSLGGILMFGALLAATLPAAPARAQTYTPGQSSVSGTFSPSSFTTLSSTSSTTSNSSSSTESSGTTSNAANTGGSVTLPVAEDGNSVAGQAISLPGGAGSPLGMGESFSAQLTTGLATYTVPIGLPKARGAVQPNLVLAYSSSSGTGIAGTGWNIGASAITRKTDFGMPRYDDRSEWHPNQDRFSFGASDLVPICVVSSGSCAGALGGEIMPAWADGWQYFRSRVDDSYLRFFWSSDHLTWRIQSKDGVTLEFGVPLDGSSYEGALESNAQKPSEIVRWHIVRQYDAHIDPQSKLPVNIVQYRYLEDGGIAYLSDIFDTPPVASSADPKFDSWAHHVRITYEERPDKLTSYRSGWRTDFRLRLTTIDVTAKRFDSTTAARQLVRRYHLDYDSSRHVSALTSFQAEGRCSFAVEESASGALPSTSCPRLPALKFEYQKVTSSLAAAKDAAGLSFEPFATDLQSLSNSPPHSLGQMETSLMDVNGDSLPDVLVTAAGLYDGKHGLYLNGSKGSIGFTAEQGMTISGDTAIDAGVLKFSNPNVSALDIDSDGRINFVYMPGPSRYTVFTPTNSTTGWNWQATGVSAPSGQSVKIDWTRHAKQTRVLDVNGDGLVDVVYSSATELQTFFSLGRFPGGKGQFGHAELKSSTEANLSTEPVRACVPWSATPVRFGDSDIYVAEMNGDGLPDIVRVRSGQLLYWPGRGNGTWGTGSRDDCAGGTFGSDRAVQVQNAPYLEPLETSTFLISDVNGDGLGDLVKVRANAVDVYLNENGTRVANRVTLDNTPFHPNGSNRVALTDINGSGTPDLLWGEAYNYRYIDLTGGIQPLLLKKVHNGLGATTELEYSTSTKLMLAAETSGKPWASTMPLATPVVVRSTVRDNLEKIGRAAGALLTEYRYRDPVFDGKSRDFVGFRSSEVWSYGDINSPTSVQRTESLMGDMATSGDSDAATSWRDALKGLPVIEEQHDESGVYLSTRHMSYEVKGLYQGLDGRRVWRRGSATTTTFAYDTDQFDAQANDVSLVDYSASTPSGTFTGSRSLTVRATAGTARIRASATPDDFGNVTTSVKEGCVSGCPAGADEPITVTSRFERPQGDTSGWLWREVESYVTAGAHPEQRQHKESTYSQLGDLVDTQLWLSGTLPLDRFHEAGGDIAPTLASASGGITDAVRITTAHRQYDSFGNPVSVTGPNGQCATMVPDELYAEFAIESTSYAGTISPDGCGDRTFTTTATYDRGFGLPLTIIAPQGQPSAAEYDGFGRILSKYGPNPSAPLTLNTQAQQTFAYEFTTDSVTLPYSRLRTRTLDQDAAGTFSYEEDWAFVDGLGRGIFSLTEADPSAGDAGQYIVAGGVSYNRKGMPFETHERDFYSGSPSAFPLNSQPTTATKRQVFDAFGRLRQSILQDGNVEAEVHYHALSVDTYDAGDLSNSDVYQGTYSTQINDGHGRPVVAISRFRDGQDIEEHKSINHYLPTGEVTEIIERRAGSPDYTRTFKYDSLGRMVENDEPNTTVFDGNGNVLHTWRYAYDNSSRLVGTSDAMGCGVNYHYDAGGRLIGSDYSPCKGNHAAYSEPDELTGDGFETYYRYDSADPAAANVVDATGVALSINSSWLVGRLASVETRGAFEAFAYDGLGRTIGTAKRVARPGAPSPNVSERYAPRWYVKQTTYDDVNRATRVTTGAPTLPLLASDGTSELRLSYTRRGLVRSVGSSYGTLVSSEVRDARGFLENVTYGDAAQTQRHYSYNVLTQVSDVQTSRASAALWTADPGSGPYVPPPVSGPNTTQLSLEDYSFKYDVMGNLESATDLRTPEEWPATAKPVDRTFKYDSYSRLTKATYAYAAGSAWQSPFEPENTTPLRQPQPSPQVSFASRIGEETFKYDWLNNLVENGDDSHGFYDRSIGTSTFANSRAPHRLTTASNRNANSPNVGELGVTYDGAGQVTGLVVQRDGACLPSGSSCWQRFVYEWDEIGNLVHAVRWDLSSNERTNFGTVSSTPPARAPDADLRYTYDGTSRVLKTAATSEGDKQTVYVFTTLELRSTEYAGTGSSADYALSTDSTQVRLSAGSASVRVVLDSNMPHVTTSSLHLLLEFGDHLGSTSFTIDHSTGELVQYSTYGSYGTAESDYRPARWDSFREPYRFTGKEEDIEVGLNYHGARYYSPALRRWMSPDPATIHSAGSDVNPYSYGFGNPTSYVDPDGRNPVLIFVAVVAIAAAVSATTNAVVQYETTGHVNWGWKGVAGAALAGGAGAAVGMGVGGIAAAAGAGVYGAAAIGGAVGGATSGALGTGLAGGSWNDVGKGALTGAVAGAIGGAVGVAAGSASTNGLVAFGGTMAGTGAGTAAGIGWSAAAYGDMPTWQSAGVAFASAFGGAIASTALGNGIQNSSELETNGEAEGVASGKAARASSQGGEADRYITQKTGEFQAALAAIPDLRVADIWLEGAGPGEVPAHQSISIGNPRGTYRSFSFAVMGTGADFGAVYEDFQGGGRIVEYIKTDRNEDAQALAYIFEQMEADSRPTYGAETCRTYSQDKLRIFKIMFRDSTPLPASIPQRTPPAVPWYSKVINWLSTVVSSPGSSTSR